MAGNAAPHVVARYQPRAAVARQRRDVAHGLLARLDRAVVHHLVQSPPPLVPRTVRRLEVRRPRTYPLALPPRRESLARRPTEERLASCCRFRLRPPM